MKFKSYKALIKKMNEKKEVIVTISLWTYSSKRMTYCVPFSEIEKYLDGDMLFKYGDFKVKFTLLNGERRSFEMYKLKIAKVDSVQIDNELIA
ncbi:hypothetical protein [Bacillus atrophaeus]|uniref:hypothetical protein n=1 Tax=Bacillus atrophaeus TaxID=1452 RepID=UPI002E244C25|nr:hypothetical protein [Bacillus atrophaeus]